MESGERYLMIALLWRGLAHGRQAAFVQERRHFGAGWTLTCTSSVTLVILRLVVLLYGVDDA